MMMTHHSVQAGRPKRGNPRLFQTERRDSNIDKREGNIKCQTFPFTHELAENIAPSNRAVPLPLLVKEHWFKF